MLRITEIYAAIMGESRHSGWPCAIVRLTGCHRRCVYCDTAYAFHGGEKIAVPDVLDAVARLGQPLMMVTGGEPLLQAPVVDLMQGGLDRGLEVVLETSGTVSTVVPLSAVPAGVCRVVDVKTPGSGIAADQVDWQGLSGLTPDDEIKLVITGVDDYAWARTLVTDGLEIAGVVRRLPVGVPVTLSPGWGDLPPRDLAGWVLRDRLPVRFQVQLHKVVWPEAEGGV